MMENCTPMVAQYLEIKKCHQDEILFFRLGDFYEMFFDDALLASQELEIVLTARDGGNKNKIPMCGVPYHAVDTYIAKLVAKGHKVAICEQVQDPALAKGIVQREVIRVVTAGSFQREDAPVGSNNYILHIRLTATEVILTLADIFTGEFKYQRIQGGELFNKLQDSICRLNPSEILLETGMDAAVEAKLRKILQIKSAQCNISQYRPEQDERLAERHFGGNLPDDPEVRAAIELLLAYLHYILKIDFFHINKLTEIVQNEYMALDASTLRNLELLRNTSDLTTKGSLFGVLNATKTSMGARKLRSAIEFPLLNIGEIVRRQEAVAVFMDNLPVQESLSEILKKICDIERLISKAQLNSLNPRDVLALAIALRQLPELRELLDGLRQSFLLKQMYTELDLQPELCALLCSAISEQPPLSVKDGGVFREGFSSELDELRALSADSDTWLTEFEQKQREATGIRTLKIGYNKVFGYYIEVSKGSIAAVPAHFVRKQTLVNAERYIVEELKNFEDKILGAKERVYKLEMALFEELRQAIRDCTVALQNIAGQLALLDMLLSFAVVAMRYNYVRPKIQAGQSLYIEQGRHPVVERLLRQEVFIANDTDFAEAKIHIITGPNMAGKSTYMRQVALICIMAQMGSFIPAVSAVLSPMEQVFTRVGASDDLATGQSTFMVEMQEVANILAQANAKSLIILDEVGRGTSTYDGISIARAVVEYIERKIKAKTLFATHYHELIELENCLHEVKNYSVAIRERGRNIVFLRRIVAGGSDKSYGIHVAQLAGLPKPVLERAEALVELYSGDNVGCQTAPAEPKIGSKQNVAPVDMFTQALIGEFLDYDIPSMTPIEALNTLNELQSKFKKLR